MPTFVGPDEGDGKGRRSTTSAPPPEPALPRYFRAGDEAPTVVIAAGGTTA